MGPFRYHFEANHRQRVKFNSDYYAELYLLYTSNTWFVFITCECTII